MKNRQKMAVFGQKLNVFGPRQAVEDPAPPILRVRDAKMQDVGRHRAGKHNSQHPYVPKFAVFHEKSPKMAVFWSKIEFFRKMSLLYALDILMMSCRFCS